MSGAATDDLPIDRDEQAADWCVRLGEGVLPPADQAAFDAWLAAPANRAAFEEALDVWQGAEAVAGTPELIQVRAAALESFRRANSRRWTRRISGRWYVPASAAAAILLLLFAGILLLRVPTEIYETGIGERRVAMLEDGSRLSLDAASRVEARMTAGRRELRLLSGRAKFDVAHDSLRPFSVAAGEKVIVATGTSFSVELVADQVRVVLYEGRVDVLDRSGGSGVARPLRLPGVGAASARRGLAPGNELVASLAGPTGSVAAADLVRSLAWESGQLSFDNEPLPTAVERMNRYSPTPLAVADAGAADIRVSGVFTAGDMDAFVEGVTALHGLRAERRDGRLILRSH